MPVKYRLHIPPALKHRRFALYWAGILISNAGSQMQVWAIFWHLRELSSDPIVVSGIGFAKFIPIMIFALFGGLVADTFNRRNIAIITQVMLMTIALILGLLTNFAVIDLWQIYLLVAFQSIATSFDSPARQSLIPTLVENREDLPSAFSMNSIAIETGAVVGPALSGLVIATLGLQWIYWINAVSFLAVIAALLMIGPVPQVISLDPRKNQSGFGKLDFSGIPEGIRFILRNPIILSSMILDFFATFFSSANTLLPFVVQDILHVGAIQYGWLSAAQSVGAVTVALIMAESTNIRKQGKLLLGGVTLFGVATILFGISHSFAFTMIALILVGAGDAVSTVLRNTIRQLQTPDQMRGRMVSINQIFFAGGPQLGEVEAGAVASAVSTPFAIITGGIGCIIAVAIVAVKWPALRKYNGDEQIKAGSI